MPENIVSFATAIFPFLLVTLALYAFVVVLWAVDYQCEVDIASLRRRLRQFMVITVIFFLAAEVEFFDTAIFAAIPVKNLLLHQVLDFCAELIAASLAAYLLYKLYWKLLIARKGDQITQA